MEPLTPNDPLWKVLGQAKPVEPRPNFVQNVVRQARQTPQERGFLDRVHAWFAETGSVTSRIAWAGAAAAVIALVAALPALRESPVEVAQVQVEKTVTPAAEVPLFESDFPLVPESDTQWATMEQFDALLAVEDTSELTDREIHFLLY
ncbi:MAG: hypothetical protein U0984_17065 [Prosthecobacter sp.]|nr:hypothetical protein [Prosthecobacter sp.]